jgi:hypothetical protein
MYYLARQLQASRDAEAAGQNGHRAADRRTVSDPEELGVLARTGAMAVAAMAGVGLILWIAN